MRASLCAAAQTPTDVLWESDQKESLKRLLDFRAEIRQQ